MDNVNVWFQDEARFGQRNTTARIWAEKGSRPRAVQQQQFQNAYLFGAVCVNTGQIEAIVSPVNNMEVMTKHLQLISDATPVGKHSVIIMDQASWHQTYLEYQFLTSLSFLLRLIHRSLIQLNKCGVGCDRMKLQIVVLKTTTTLSINAALLGIDFVKIKTRYFTLLS